MPLDANPLELGRTVDKMWTECAKRIPVDVARAHIDDLADVFTQVLTNLQHPNRQSNPRYRRALRSNVEKELTLLLLDLEL